VVAPSIPASPAASAEDTSAAPAPIAKAEPQPGPPAPSAAQDDAGSVDQYRLQLISVAKRYKRYPRVAMDNNWEGDVVVRMVIDANGMIAAVSVKTGSGHEVLDSQALEMFKRAKPLVPIPSALRGREFIIELRAIYNLRDHDSG
jgi:protein TonB